MSTLSSVEQEAVLFCFCYYTQFFSRNKFHLSWPEHVAVHSNVFLHVSTSPRIILLPPAWAREMLSRDNNEPLTQREARSGSQSH